MEKIMLVGETRVGKSSLIRALSGEEYSPRRAMAVEHIGRFINTPGEFLENSWFYHALINTAADCSLMLFVVDATRKTTLFPPLFAPIFNRKVVGVLTNVDDPDADIPRAERFLLQAGAREVVRTSARTGEGLDTLLEMLQ